jgi:hypothetical protein
MKKLFAAVLSVAVGLSLSPAMGAAQTSCPAEVAQAKDMLSKKTAMVKPDDIQAPRSLAGARSTDAVQAPRGNQDVQSPRGSQDIQAPRSLAGARSTDTMQAPRGSQDVQAPRGNDSVQAPRGNQNVQAPRGNDSVQAPRGSQDVQAPRTGAGSTITAQAPRADVTKAASLVKEAEAACKSGNMALATDKAKAALAILK